MFVNWQMDKTVVYLYNKCCLAIKRNKQLIQTTAWVNLVHYAKASGSKSHILCDPIDMSLEKAGL